MVIKSSSYYLDNTNSNCNNIRIVLKHPLSLKLIDFKTLWANNWRSWVSNFLVEYCIHIFCISHNLPGCYLDCDQGMNLFGLGRTRLSNFTWRSIQMRLLGDSMVIIIPILVSNHFSIAIIDKRKNAFIYLDSKQLNTTQIIFGKLIAQVFKYEQKFQNKLNNKGQSLMKLVNNLKIQNVPCHIQDDEVHCGIYLLSNLENYLNENNIIMSMFNPTSYRMTLMNLILKSSENIQNMCPSCGTVDNSSWSDESSITTNDDQINEFKFKWIRCDYCRRWWHYRCTQLTKSIDVSIIELIPFYCILCLRFFKR